tara:strand:- start:129479 stop:129979 length:501 start_codon:yes stop_codon:yes gene_type:complete
MSRYTIGKKIHEMPFNQGKALENILHPVCLKLGVLSLRHRIVCQEVIDRDYLLPILEEAERWYLDDFEPDEERSMIVPKEDIKQFKELNEILETIIKRNSRKKEKTITYTEGKKLIDTSSFLLTFEPEEDDRIRCKDGHTMEKKTLQDLVNHVRDASPALMLKWRD